MDKYGPLCIAYNNTQAFNNKTNNPPTPTHPPTQLQLIQLSVILCLQRAVDTVQADRQMTHFGLHVCNNFPQDIMQIATLSLFLQK